MRSSLRRQFAIEMTFARQRMQDGSLDAAFAHLERAHVLGQRYIVPHLQTHWLMLKIGISRRAAGEVIGQAIRLVLGVIGSAIGVVPTGNTGGTNISMFKRLPIEPELAQLLDESRQSGR